MKRNLTLAGVTALLVGAVALVRQRIQRRREAELWAAVTDPV